MHGRPRRFRQGPAAEQAPEQWLQTEEVFAAARFPTNGETVTGRELVYFGAHIETAMRSATAKGPKLFFVYSDLAFVERVLAATGDRLRENVFVPFDFFESVRGASSDSWPLIRRFSCSGMACTHYWSLRAVHAAESCAALALWPRWRCGGPRLAWRTSPRSSPAHGAATLGRCGSCRCLMREPLWCSASQHRVAAPRRVMWRCRGALMKP